MPGLTKLVVVEGSRNVVGPHDHVHYFHESRFDNGQLVDVTEKRKAAEKFIMDNQLYHEFYRKMFKTMKKGEIAWGVFSPEHHGGMYHKNLLPKLPEEQRAQIGDKIYIKFTV